MKRIAAMLLLAGSAAQAADAPFLWQVSGPHARHYLMGSVHLLPQNAYPLPAPLEAAYNAADALVLESDLATLTDAQTQMDLLAQASAPEGLKALAGAELYRHVQNYATAHHLPASICDSFKPWFCALTLEVLAFQQSDYRADLGLDQHFFSAASASQKAVLWLEEPRDHLKLFTAMPESASREMLKGTLDEESSEGGSPEELLQAWQHNDLAAMRKLVADFKNAQPALYDRLLAARNRAWVPRLAQMLDAPRTRLVIVGAAHLVGDEGLIAMLKARGFKIEPVPMGEASARR